MILWVAKMTKLINYDEAINFWGKIEDDSTRTLVSITIRRLEMLAIEGVKPAADFDMLYFAKVLESTFADHQKLRRILDGEKIEWPQV